jgi:hypothetical protein
VMNSMVNGTTQYSRIIIKCKSYFVALPKWDWVSERWERPQAQSHLGPESFAGRLVGRRG